MRRKSAQNKARDWVNTQCKKGRPISTILLRKAWLAGYYSAKLQKVSEPTVVEHHISSRHDTIFSTDEGVK